MLLPPTPEAQEVVSPMLGCSFCRHRPEGKPASAYIAVFPSTGTRYAYKLKAGPECIDELRDMLRPFLASPLLGEVEIDSCRGCGIGLDFQTTFMAYCTLYLPKQESQLFEAMHCEPCAAHFHDLVKTFGVALPDRTPSESPDARATHAWDALGLAPTAA